MASSLAVSFILYSLVLLAIGYHSYQGKMKEKDFHIGGRNINFWITAISSHASDMSNWLFLGFPVAIYLNGLKECWVAVGLLLGMWLNWHLVAPRIRVLSEKTKSVTLPDLLSRLTGDKTDWVKIVSCMACLFFFLFYIAAGLKGIGGLLNILFGLSTVYGVVLAALIISAYVILGGFIAVTTADAFQGMFLLLSIVVVPICLIFNLFDANINLTNEILSAFESGNESSFFDFSYGATVVFGWGLGYFGMPHIINKFMSIDDPKNLKKSKYLGLAWQFTALSASAAIGILAHQYFSNQVQNPEYLFLDLVLYLMNPLWAGFIFCAILAATISTIDSQVIVSATSLSKDLLKLKASKAILWTRIFILSITLLSAVIAIISTDTLYNIVFYAWSGQGSTFGPLVLFVLYVKKIPAWGAVSAMICGAFIAAVWPYTSYWFHETSMIPGFFFSSLVLFLSLFFRDKPA